MHSGWLQELRMALLHLVFHWNNAIIRPTTWTVACSQSNNGQRTLWEKGLVAPLTPFRNSAHAQASLSLPTWTAYNTGRGYTNKTSFNYLLSQIPHSTQIFSETVWCDRKLKPQNCKQDVWPVQGASESLNQQRFRDGFNHSSPRAVCSMWWHKLRVCASNLVHHHTERKNNN
mgnify:CR=1 FL=1